MNVENKRSIGVRELSQRPIGCKGFEVNKEILRRASEKHEAMLQHIRKLFEARNINCEEGFEVRYGDIRGYIDLLCEDDKNIYLIEVKSTRAHYARIQDFMQLAIYAFMFIEQTKELEKDLQLYLIYNYFGEHPTNPFSIKITGKGKNWLISLGKSLVENVLQQDENNLYVISDLCYLCQNTRCPFRLSREVDNS
ncbi:MAG: PD-(D/E)XK nuclease family protein [Caldisericum sp.]|nr:PD-(D/E)XK nuclease family protein [Caldisericum sp.]